MAQETATSMTAPEGAIWQAWLDALLRPQFETFQRWYPRMGQKWRRVSLVVSLVLIVLTSLAHAVFSAAGALPAMQSLTLAGISAYLASGRGLFGLFRNFAGSVAMLYAIPVVVAWWANREIGPYPVRFRVVFGTWMQVQPTVCVLLLFSAVAQVVLAMLGLFDSYAHLGDWEAWVVMLLVIGPAWISWYIYSCEALAAGSGRYLYQVGLITVVPAICVYLVLWVLLPAILRELGHPVL